jgi:single-stranded-DNA-specific exonuclease
MTTIQVYKSRADFNYNRRRYTCYIMASTVGELKIKNNEDQTLSVKQGQRVGILQVPERNPREVDITQPHFYNLIRAAVQALETEEKNKVISEKDQLIAGQKQVLDGKNDQINALKQQLAILNEQFSQLTAEQAHKLRELQDSIQKKEAEARKREAQIESLTNRIRSSVVVQDSEKIRNKIQATLGDLVWSKLSESSQRNLIASVVNFHIAKQREFLKDYSEAVSRLGIVVETEIISLFFNSFYTFLREKMEVEVAYTRLAVFV